ncbi:unnamed protein product [Mycena citricolor]|uniref:HlyIII-domain-containing protein n=1 Tax=Mycena citricolor TaxID=2018698 RepID=A0AAD2GRQ8_9AGAR|nr:unnamed protein product [Mycena citricolor]CAK5274800.1 unnamed protein product [Mycena citricolor]
MSTRLRNRLGKRTSGGGKIVKGHPTVSWDELPEWQRDNEYILTGYRRIQNHWPGCIQSVYAYFHNESVNIHTHLAGGILFIYFLATFREVHMQQYAASTWVDSAVLAVFLISAVFCLLASAFFHTSTCHSKEVASRCHALDYSGIVILTVGEAHSIPLFILVFSVNLYCKGCISYPLLSSASVRRNHSHAPGPDVLGDTGAAYVVLDPEYAKPTHRGARTGVFIGLGLSGIVPVVHCTLTSGVHRVFFQQGFSWIVVSAALYIAGALLYANRIPERLAPGKFDYLFASHQIFHCCVVAAATAHYAGVLTALRFTYSESNVCA